MKFEIAATIVLLSACSTRNSGGDVQNKNSIEDSLSKGKEIQVSSENCRKDSLGQFLEYFEGDDVNTDPNYEFRFIREIPGVFVYKYLDIQDPEAVGSKYFSESIKQLTDYYLLIYNRTCAAGGYCYGKHLALLSKQGELLQRHLIAGKFGDFENQEIITPMLISDSLIVLKKIKCNISVETLDTLQKLVSLDSVRITTN